MTDDPTTPKKDERAEAAKCGLNRANASESCAYVARELKSRGEYKPIGGASAGVIADLEFAALALREPVVTREQAEVARVELVERGWTPPKDMGPVGHAATVHAALNAALAVGRE